VGRHRAEPEVRQRGQRAAKQPDSVRRSPELLGWGLFISATTAACLLWARIPAPVTAGTSALVLAAFAAAWYASRGTARPERPDAAAAAPQAQSPAARETPEPAADRQQPAPTRTQDEPARPLAPAIPLAPGAAREFLSAPVPGGSGTQASRWTRTFGPPETGSLPLQPYVPALRASVQTADSERHDRRQRSHSSL